MKRVFYTTGRVKCIRTGGDGYIIPDQSLEGYTGINIYFQANDLKLSIGDCITVKFRVLEKQLIALEIV